jgi:hypothetical protein
LRDYVGLPPIEKPPGYEQIDDDDGLFAEYMEIAIDVELNVPVLVSEKLVLWDQRAPTERPKSKGTVQWNGIKEDPLELYMTVNGKNIVLLQATGIAVKFSSEQAINSAIGKVQQIVDASTTDMLLQRIEKKFKRSRFWKPNGLCVDQIKEADGRA